MARIDYIPMYDYEPEAKDVEQEEIEEFNMTTRDLRNRLNGFITYYECYSTDMTDVEKESDLAFITKLNNTWRKRIEVFNPRDEELANRIDAII
jgi:hypothetical protein